MLNVMRCFVFLMLAGSLLATPIRFWWSGDRTQEGQMTIFNPDAQDGDTGIPVYSADIDNDGYDDALLSAMTGDGPQDNKSSAGELHVLFGGDSIRGLLDFADDLTLPNVFTIWGRSARDYLGAKSSAGDMDDDGTKDLIVSAAWCNSMGRTNAGEVYIVWGGSYLRGQQVDIANAGDVEDFQITIIRGAEADDKLGTWVTTGDVDHDGHTDMLIGAPRANGFANTAGADQTGECYLLYGPFSRSDTIDLANPGDQRMTVIFGIDPDDQMGTTCELGDINGDGFDDMVIGAGAQEVARLGDTDIDYPFETGGAGDGPDNNRNACGEAYFLFGSDELPDTINLAAGMPEGSMVVWGAHGIENEGEPGGDEFGEDISIADINGDGLKDVMIGAFRADGMHNDTYWAGATYLFYGQHVWPSEWDLLNGVPDSVSAFYGEDVDRLMGDTTPLGDINGDGYFDILFGCVHGGGPYRIFKSGALAVMLGKPELFPPYTDFQNLPDTTYLQILQGAEVSDLTAYWATTGDFNNDGYWDLIPNVMHGDGPNNERNNAGDFYIISGEWLTNHPGQPRYLSLSPNDDGIMVAWWDNQERGTDAHIVYRRELPNGELDSIGFAPYPMPCFFDSFAVAGVRYEYRVKAVNPQGYYSNLSLPVEGVRGLSIGTGIPLIVNGIDWDSYGSEAINFYQDSVLLGPIPFEFWDLMSTNTYPEGITPIGFGIDSLADEIFQHRAVLWMLNAFDDDNPNDHDGHKFREFGPELALYVQNGGCLYVIGKEMGDWIDDQLETNYFHVVNWGFQVSVTNTAELTPVYSGLPNIGRNTTNIANLEPFAVDESGCTQYLYTYNNSSYQWMAAASRPSVVDWFNLVYISTRPYRADPTELRQAMDFIIHNIMQHYYKVDNVATQSPAPGVIGISWNESQALNETGYWIYRQVADESSPVDTLAFIAAGTEAYLDTVPSPLMTYKYWIISEHEDGRFSLPSDTVSGFSPPTVDPGTMLIINGLDWATYGASVYDLYNQHVLQGNRPFRFWDLFTTATYPPGYTPIGTGLNGLVDQIWQAGMVIWVFNGFGGDETIFQTVQPALETYLESGGKLVLIGKEMNNFLSPTLRTRLGIESFGAFYDWAENDSLWGEHPSLQTIAKQSGVSMSLVPDFAPRDAPEVYPLYRLAGTADSYYGVLSAESAVAPFSTLFLSMRPYRISYPTLAAAMDTLLTGYMGQSLNAPVQNVAINFNSNNGTIGLHWQALPGATGYRIVKHTFQGEPDHIGTVFDTTTGTTYTDASPVLPDIIVSYKIYPIW